MYLFRLLICSLLCTLWSCQHSTTFDRNVWLTGTEMTDTRNPRARMVQDVLRNHLKAGMPRQAVVSLLGQPYQEGIERRLPKNTILPDSISSENPEVYKPENREKTIAALNAFYRVHAKPVMIMRYPIGWSTIDPNFLVIQLTSKGVVESCRIEQG